MVNLWDYDEAELKKTEKGRIFLLERMINYSSGKERKIKLAEVKRYWDKLHLFETRRRLLNPQGLSLQARLFPFPFKCFCCIKACYRRAKCNR